MRVAHYLNGNEDKRFHLTFPLVFCAKNPGFSLYSPVEIQFYEEVTVKAMQPPPPLTFLSVYFSAEIGQSNAEAADAKQNPRYPCLL